METATAKTFRMALSEPTEYLAGQHMVLRLTAPDGYTASRSYSIASAPDRSHGSDEIELTVEHLADGEVSSFLHDEVVVGDQLEVRGPIGGWFVWRGRGSALLVGGGSGVVPLMAMLRLARRAGRSDQVHLVVSARTPEDLYYASELTGPEVTRPLYPECPRRLAPATGSDHRHRPASVGGRGGHGLRVRLGGVRRRRHRRVGGGRRHIRTHPGREVRPHPVGAGTAPDPATPPWEVRGHPSLACCRGPTNERGWPMDHDKASRLLGDERRRTQGLLAGLTEEQGDDRTAADEPGDMFDSAEPLIGEIADDSVAAELQVRLAAIGRAEKRLEAGTYGYSVRTGLPIPDERLEADPTAELTAEEAAAADAGGPATL